MYPFGTYYSGREAPSLKLGRFFFSRRAAKSRSWLVDEKQLGRWHGASGEEWNVGEWNACSACLTWLYGLFVRTLISRTNAYAGCGRPALNCIERFWLGSVRSDSKLNSQCTQMNYKMNCITMHKCTEMYSKRPEYNGECQSCFANTLQISREQRGGIKAFLASGWVWNYYACIRLEQDSEEIRERNIVSTLLTTSGKLTSYVPSVPRIIYCTVAKQRVRFFKRIKNQIKTPDHTDFVYQKKQKSKNGFFQRWACETQRF